ncbi:hypothetical protein EUX98_g4481 [Antrodiella citrinella]|uniref:Major facilitator superfamily (MFS) profile domain-containing protein n=1 Tax=Antrodiella citrinella TaxID=2447956 RepID=A0A4S4MTU7_9APHY|nr:hypothetical protein EUX98_g4481 [Antrodiella citrinella]
MFTRPGTRMTPVLLVVLFGWWGFNTLSYFVPLYLQQVLLLSPLQASVRLIPMGISGLVTNLTTGYIIAVVPGQVLVLISLFSCLASGVVFALIDVHASYWAMTFIVMITLPVLDIAYTVGNMQVCLSFDRNSQALAGSIFGVATRLGTSIGLAVSSSVAVSVSQKFLQMPAHAHLSATDPEVLMSGFRAAGWTCVGALSIALVVAVIGLRGIGLIGQQTEEKRTSVIEMGRMSIVVPGDEEAGPIDIDTTYNVDSVNLDSDSRTQVNISPSEKEKDEKADLGSMPV